MQYSPARWTRAAVAAALIALPLTAAAQTTPPQTDPKPAPQQADPKPAPTPQQPPSTPSEPQAATAQAPQSDTKVDAVAAKQHLSQARDTLSQLTSLPEAARLQGDARTQVSSLISNFNELITTQADWRSAYTKVDANLSALLGPDSPDPAQPATGVTGAVGTSGAAATVQLDPAVRTKLAEFRMHVKAFERAAGSGSSGAMAPSAATGSTSNPANAADPSNPAGAAGTAGTAGTAGAAGAAGAGATGTSGVSPSSPTANMAPADQAKAAEQVGHSEADKHLDAISAILNQSKTGALTKAQTDALKKHVAELRTLLGRSK